MPKMRAKMEVESVKKLDGLEILKLHAVSKPGNYPEDGSDEDNTYAKWTPSALMEIHIANPALHGQFKEGQKFYVDFTETT